MMSWQRRVAQSVFGNIQLAGRQQHRVHGTHRGAGDGVEICVAGLAQRFEAAYLIGAFGSTATRQQPNPILFMN